MRPSRPPLSRPMISCSTAWPPTRWSTSPMRCTRNSSPAQSMAGSRRATKWRYAGPRGASASISTARSTWKTSTAPWSRPRGSTPPRRSRMVRPNQDMIGGQPKSMLQVDETWVGGRTRGEGRAVHHKVLVACVRSRCVIERPGTKLDNRKDGRYAGRVRLRRRADLAPSSRLWVRRCTVAGSLSTDDWSGMLASVSAAMSTSPECGDPEAIERFLPIIDLVFANLKTWTIGIHHGATPAPTSLPPSSPSASTGGPVQRLPLIARHRGRHLCSNLCRALLGRVAAPYM